MDLSTRGANPIGEEWVRQLLDPLLPHRRLQLKDTSHLEDLAKVLGDASLQELLSLREEEDPQIFFQDLMGLAQRLSRDSHPQEAFFLLQWIEENSPEYLPESSSPLWEQAKRERLALAGQGPLGYQLEHLSRRFVKEVCDPGMIGGMMLAWPVAQGVRYGSLRGILGMGRLPLLTTGVGARLTASTLAFSAEVPTFLFASKGIHHLIGPPQDWSLPTLSKELQGLGIGLFFLKSFGRLGHRLSAWQRGVSPHLPFSPSALTLATLYPGVLLGHHYQVQWGLRPGQSLNTTLLEGLLFMVQIQAGGQISQALMGRGLTQKISQLDAHSEILAEQIRRPWDPPFLPQLLSFQPAMAGGFPEVRIADMGPRVILMEPIKPVGGGTKEILAKSLSDALGERHGIAREYSKLKNIEDHFANTQFTIQPERSSQRYFDFIKNHHIQEVRFKDGEILDPVEILERATRVFRHVLEHEAFRRGTGSFYDYLIQVALERTLEENHSRAFDQLVKAVTYQRTPQDIENFFENQDWKYRYQIRKGLVTLGSRAPKWYERLKKLELARPLQNSIAGYLATYSLGETAKPFRDPGYNFLLMQRSHRGPIPKSMQANYALRALERTLNNSSQAEEWLTVLGQVAERADQSPVGLLYYDRLFKVLATGGLAEKVVELSDPYPFHWGWVQEVVRSDSGPDFVQSGARINGSIYTGYVSDIELSEKFARFYHLLGQELHPERARVNRQWFYEHADITLGTKKNFGQKELLELLRHRPTRLATMARQAILNKEIDFKVVDENKMMKLITKYGYGNGKDGVPEGAFIPGNRTRSGKPLIAIKELDPTLSREEKISEAISLAAIAVHEFDHYLFHHKMGSFTQSKQLRSEMRAWLEENHYLIMQGDLSVWNRAQTLTPQGFGVHLRKLVDKDYIDGPRDWVVLN